jgi:hypothetical protein
MNSGSGSNTKIWEHGRAAYLNWAAALPSGSVATSSMDETDKAKRERIELERMKKEVQGVTSAETLGKLRDDRTWDSCSTHEYVSWIESTLDAGLNQVQVLVRKEVRPRKEKGALLSEQ